jgi:hypothetical protein
MSADEPMTIWEEKKGVRSGGGAVIRAASYSVGGSLRGAVTLSLRVPDGFWEAIEGGGMAATLLLDPDEARGFATWLDRAAAAAVGVGPALYGDGA